MIGLIRILGLFLLQAAKFLQLGAVLWIATRQMRRV